MRSVSRTEETRIRSGSPGGRFVSRSAPDNAGAMSSDQDQDPRAVMTKDRERRHSNVSSASSSVPPSPQVHLTTVTRHTQNVAENGHYVTGGFIAFAAYFTQEFKGKSELHIPNVRPHTNEDRRVQRLTETDTSKPQVLPRRHKLNHHHSRWTFDRLKV